VCTPTRTPEINFSLNKEAAFPLENWHPPTRLHDATCQKLRSALFWDITQRKVAITIFELQEVLALEDGTDRL